MKKLFLLLGIFLNCSSGYCWNGYDWNLGENIEIEKGNLVRTGRDIEVYHSGEGEYHNEEVVDISRGELETYDFDTGEYHTYDMD